jgi:predicted PurR-regulated permease PerM
VIAEPVEAVADVTTASHIVAGATAPGPIARYPAWTTPSRPAVVATVAGLLVVALFLVASGALPLFVVGLLLAYLIDPGVTWLERRRMQRWLASLLVILALSGLIAAFVLIIAGSVISQGISLIGGAPTALEQVRAWFATLPLTPSIRDAVDRTFTDLGTALGSIDLVGVVSGVVGSLFGFVGVLLGGIGLPFYVFIVVNDRPALVRELQRRLPAPWRDDILTVLGIVVRQFGNYARSETVLMVLLGGITWLGLMLLSIVVDPRIGSYALFLSIVAAFSELIPLFGPWIATIPAVVFGITLGPVPLVAIVILYVLISFIEGNVMVPAIEGRSFALRPAVVAPAIAIGLAVGGTFGAVLALPLASAARDVYLYVFRRSTGLSGPDARQDGSATPTLPFPSS